MLKSTARGVPRFSITSDPRSSSTRRSGETTIAWPHFVFIFDPNSSVHRRELYSLKDWKSVLAKGVMTV